MTHEIDRKFRLGMNRLQKVEWLDCFIKARSKSLNESNISGGWRGAGLVPIDESRIIQLIQPSESTPPPLLSPTVTTPSNEMPLFLSSSPPDAITLHRTNMVLMQKINESNLDSPIRNPIRREDLALLSDFMLTDRSILKRENKELKKLVYKH